MTCLLLEGQCRGRRSDRDCLARAGLTLFGTSGVDTRSRYFG